MNKEPKAEKQKTNNYQEIIKLFNNNFSSLAEIVYEDLSLKINFKLDILKKYQDFKDLKKTIEIKRNENQKIINKEEINEWLAGWYKCVRKKLQELKRLTNIDDLKTEGWFVKYVQKRVEKINATWKAKNIKKSLTLIWDKKILILVDKSGEKPTIIKKTLDPKNFNLSRFFDRLEQQKKITGVPKLKSLIRKMEKENMHFGFEINANNILLYDKTGMYENNVDFTNINTAIEHLKKFIEDTRWIKMQIENKLTILNTKIKDKKYDYFLSGNNIFITIINKQDLEAETKMFIDYNNFIDWYKNEELQ